MADQGAASPDRLGLQESLRALRRRWLLAVLVLVDTVGIALVYSLVVTPSYVATAQVLIEPSASDVQASGGAKIDADEVATQTQVVTSLPVARMVQARLGSDTVPDLSELVTVQPVGTSRILSISAQDESAQQAADTANTVATSYLQFREQSSIGRYEQARERLSQEQAEIEARLSEITAQITENPGSAAPLQAERRTLLSTLAQLGTQLDSLTDSLTAASSGGELLRSAEPAAEPLTPQLPMNLVLGILVGLVLGVGAALLRDRFDDVVHDEEGARQALDSVVLGRVPQWSGRAYRDRLVSLLDPHEPASEEYQRLAVNVRFMLATGASESGAIVLLTSAQEGEGKTVTSCNLAVAAARLGLRVAMVDADFRRASVAPRFGMGDPPGLSDLLVADDAVDSYLIDVGVDNLVILPAGTLPPNPAALLSSERMRLVLAELTSEVDLVVVDSPPILTGADTLELATLADMVIVVTRERISRRRRLVAVREALRQLSVRSVGMVHNATSDSARSTYAYRPRKRTVEPLPDARPESTVEEVVADETPTPAHRVVARDATWLPSRWVRSARVSATERR
jgi:capsular exopolysaccharide synthesis family protein